MLPRTDCRSFVDGNVSRAEIEKGSPIISAIYLNRLCGGHAWWEFMGVWPRLLDISMDRSVHGLK